MAKAWLLAGLDCPLLFHAMVFGAAVHKDFVCSSQHHPRAQDALAHKLIVIQNLKEAIEHKRNIVSDETILAISFLMVHEPGILRIPEEEKRTPFHPPLHRVQWLDFYGVMRPIPEHREAVMKIVSLRGGFHKIELYGLSETFAAYVSLYCSSFWCKFSM